MSLERKFQNFIEGFLGTIIFGTVIYAFVTSNALSGFSIWDYLLFVGGMLIIFLFYLFKFLETFQMNSHESIKVKVFEFAPV